MPGPPEPEAPPQGDDGSDWRRLRASARRLSACLGELTEQLQRADSLGLAGAEELAAAAREAEADFARALWRIERGRGARPA